MKYLLAFFVSGFFFALTYASAPTEFSIADRYFLACLFVIVFGAQVMIARMFAQNRILHNLILAGITTTNILYVNLVLNVVFIGLPSYAQLIALLVALFILLTFMNILDDNPRIAMVLPVAFALALVVVLVKTLFVAEPSPMLSAELGGTSAKNIRLVKFKEKPNVYFISFDSMIPKVLLQKHLGLETTAYHEVLDVHFRRFRNFFADGAPTKPSLHSVLALDLGHFNETINNKTSFYFFSGLIPSPLFEIFENNGYTTNTFYDGMELGTKKGQYVDNFYFNDQVLVNGVCNFIDTEGWRKPALLGYCALVKSRKIRDAMKWSGVDKEMDIDFLIDLMRKGLQNDTPQIFVSYIYSPGHTSFKYFDRKSKKQFDEYRQYYLEQSKNTASELKKIITFIAKEDPNAIVYVFGDHGPYLSGADTFENDPTFFVQDRFGVYGGIYPPDRCAESFTAQYNKDFMTILQGVHIIIRCLSGGENAFLAQEDYHLPDLKTDYFENIYYHLPGTQTKNYIRYEDYLYE